MLSIPDSTAQPTKLADWLELSAISSPDGRVGFGTFISASELSREEQPEDTADDDIWEDDLVIAAQAEIDNRRQIIGPDYPFEIDDKGDHIQVKHDLTTAGAVYLFCLFLSHANDRSIIPQTLAPNVDNAARDLFQVCATVAAAGYVEGSAFCFGAPRPEAEVFLVALHRVYAEFGDGTPVAKLPPAAPKHVQDDGIDIIAWGPSIDGLPGRPYLLGQAASGDDWVGKSVVADSNRFHKYWFTRQPSAEHQNAMFMPFCLEPKPSNPDVTRQEVLVDLMQRLTSKYGVVFYRYRMARYAAKGLLIHRQGVHVVERCSELDRIVKWVQQYSGTLKDDGK